MEQYQEVLKHLIENDGMTKKGAEDFIAMWLPNLIPSDLK